MPSRHSRDDDFRREADFHIDALARDYEAQGMAPDEARRRARIDFGGREQATQQMREVHLSAFVEALRANLRAAVRFLRRAPGLALAIILTLALGIGANTAVFSAIDAILLRPLAFPHGDELMTVQQFDKRGNAPVNLVAPARLLDWNRLNHSFQALTGYDMENESEISGALPERIDEAEVAPHFLDVWGIAPQLGRGFTPAEEQWGGPNAVILSHRFWIRRFHGDPGAIGKQLHFNGAAWTVVGIMPASFAFPVRGVDIYTPSPVYAPFARDRTKYWFNVIGRLKPGVTAGQALADLSAVQRELGRQYPQTDQDLGIRITPLKAEVLGDIGSSLWLLYGAVTLLLAIACINIAALLLARTTGRRQELALRFSLGASRRTVVVQLLSEVLLLALIGAALGIVLASAAVALFHHYAAGLPRAGEIAINWRLLLYTFGIALAATLAAGLYPALRTTRGDLARSLASNSRTQLSARGSLQWLLVGAQVAFAVTLLVGAGLLLRSFAALGRVSPGFDPDHVLTFAISGSWAEVSSRQALQQRIDTTLIRLRTLPGVVAAATTDAYPGVPGESQIAVQRVEGEQDAHHKIVAVSRTISSGYFAALGIPILLGRDCPDLPQGNYTLVNRAFADRYLQGVTPVGAHLRAVARNVQLPAATVSGIVADARLDGVNTEPLPTVFACLAAPVPAVTFLVRTHGSPMAMADAIRVRLHQIEPARSVFAISPLADHMSDARTEDRMRTGVLAFFAGTAITLACLGLYGTLSYLGRMRRREMGLRLAIGATRGQVLGAVLGQGLRVVAMGCAAGLVLALAAARLLAGMLYGVTSTDPLTYAGIVLLVAAVATAACLGPALRAARTDPARVLRED